MKVEDENDDDEAAEDEQSEADDECGVGGCRGHDGHEEGWCDSNGVAGVAVERVMAASDDCKASPTEFDVAVRSTSKQVWKFGIGLLGSDRVPGPKTRVYFMGIRDEGL